MIKIKPDFNIGQWVKLVGIKDYKLCQIVGICFENNLYLYELEVLSVDHNETGERYSDISSSEIIECDSQKLTLELVDIIEGLHDKIKRQQGWD